MKISQLITLGACFLFGLMIGLMLSTSLLNSINHMNMAKMNNKMITNHNLLNQEESLPQWSHFLFVQLQPPSWLNSGPHSNNNYNSTYFTVHGLWPEFINGSWPQYCPAPPFNSLELAPIKNELEVKWTNFRNAKSFWKHEYDRHLTCLQQDPNFSNEYSCFHFGLEKLNQYDYYSILKSYNIIPTNNLMFRTDLIRGIIQEYVGKRPIIICNNQNHLNEIITCYDKDLNIIDCPPSETKKECQSTWLYYNLYESL